MATHGSPGRMRIAKNTMLIAPRSIGIATSSRRTTYWNTVGVSPPSVHDLQQLRIIVAVVQRELPVLGIERRADALGIAGPLARHVADGQAHEVALDALLRLGVCRRPLLLVALHPALREQIVNTF